MSLTRYREERTLVRNLHRLPGQNKEEFKKNVLRLRRHFEEFNLNVSELCQWLVSSKPDNDDTDRERQVFWDFMLEPETTCPPSYTSGPDWLRHAVFEAVTGMKQVNDLSGSDLPETLLSAVSAASNKTATETTKALLKRLSLLDRSHVMILLKAASEWIGARYVRQLENWKRNLEEWRKEKDCWEKEHLDLTPAIRDKYNGIFKELDVVDKRPRVCNWAQLSENQDNCKWTGERIQRQGKWISHSPLCKKYSEFRSQLNKENKKYAQFFIDNAKKYLESRRKGCATESAMQSLIPQAKAWFPRAWRNYLTELNIKETTILQDYSGSLPHCEKLDSECKFNRHTNICTKYKDLLLSQLTATERELESKYREWRRNYLAAPQKPSLRYPSANKLPTPKLFGRDFYELDFDRHQVKLRLDEKGAGGLVSFGIKPWPRKYDYQPCDIDITSVHVHFIGTRARVGLRFTVPHRKSRFVISQDVIGDLRSRDFPRPGQDSDFLEAARTRLLDSLPSEYTDKLSIMAVDLGSQKGAVAFFTGRSFTMAELLKLRKLNVLTVPGADSTGGKKLTKEEKEQEKKRGLTEHHVGEHLDTLQKKSQEISQKRQSLSVDEQADISQTLGAYDMRHLTTHIRRMIRDWVRLNASQIIRIAVKHQVDLIVFESMRGFRAPGYDKLDQEKKRRLAYFAFGKIRHKVTEKAVERGMRVVTVPYRGSSQVCGKCGIAQTNINELKKNKKKGSFVCEVQDCGHQNDCDKNAALVIGRVFWGEIALPQS